MGSEDAFNFYCRFDPDQGKCGKLECSVNHPLFKAHNSSLIGMYFILIVSLKYAIKTFRFIWNLFISLRHLISTVASSVRYSILKLFQLLNGTVASKIKNLNFGTNFELLNNMVLFMLIVIFLKIIWYGRSIHSRIMNLILFDFNLKFFQLVSRKCFKVILFFRRW